MLVSSTKVFSHLAAPLNSVTEEASVAETAVWPNTILVSMFTALNESVLFSFKMKLSAFVPTG